MAINWGTGEFLKTDSSGEYTKDEVDAYLASLFSDFSRLKAMWQKKYDDVKAEKDAVLDERDKLQSEKLSMASDIDAYAKEFAKLDAMVKDYETELHTMSSLRTNLTEMEEERMQLIQQISEAEKRSSAGLEKLEDMSRIKEELERKNTELEEMYKVALRDISGISQEKEDALAREASVREELQMKQMEIEKEQEEAQGAIHRLLSELESARLENSELSELQQQAEEEKQKLASDVTNLKQLNEELEKTIESTKSEDLSYGDEQSSGFAISPFYKNELMSDSGFELLAMLQSMAGSVTGDGSSVQVSKSWEEESEEILDDPNNDKGKIVKKVRRKTEVSVKYTNGE